MADDVLSEIESNRFRRYMDLTGQKFGRLSVIGRAKKTLPDGTISFGFWKCLCSCGKFTVVKTGNLTNGAVKTCGRECGRKLKSETSRKRYAENPRFSQQRVPGYQSYQGARKRVSDPNHPGYRNYGGRGITMDPRWFGSFMEFLKDMGPRPPGMTLDRIDNNGNYEPTNCRWASRKEQCRNLRKNIRLKVGDQEMLAGEWSAISGIPEKNILERRRRLGWSDERAVFAPLSSTGNRMNKKSLNAEPPADVVRPRLRVRSRS